MKNNTKQAIPERSTGSRRNFLHLASTGIAVVALASVSACSKKEEVEQVQLPPDIGSGDTALLNLIYALQQIEDKFYSGLGYFTDLSNTTREEKILLNQITEHERSHAAVLKKFLINSALPELQIDFGTLNINDRNQVLNMAKLIENNSVAGINSLAFQFKNPELMSFAAKMASVDARHAAYINNLISPKTYADPAYVDLTAGMERPKTVTEILAFVNSFSKVKITANNV